MKRINWIVLFFVLIAAVAACSGVSQPTAVPDNQESEATAEAAATDSSAGGDTAELDNPASVNCVEQGGELDIRDQEGGQVGYRIFPDGSECEEWSYPEAAPTLNSALVSQGWEEDPQYQADGPMGTVSAFRQNDALCLSNISWQPSADAGCPTDQPISACELTPQQQVYMATLTCARP